MEFGAALAKADLAFVAPIYPAREAPIEGVDAGLVVAAARRLIVDKSLVREVASLDEAVGSAISALEAGDVLFTLGAGDVDQVGRRVLERLRRSHVDA